MIATLWTPPWKGLLVMLIGALSWATAAFVPVEEAATGSFFRSSTASGQLRTVDTLATATTNDVVITGNIMRNWSNLPAVENGDPAESRDATRMQSLGEEDRTR